MNTLTESAQFGVLLTLALYYFAQKRYQKTHRVWYYPLLFAPVVIIGLLVVFQIPLESYQSGGALVSWFLGPVTVLLAVPLYKKRALLRSAAPAILTGCIGGSVFSVMYIGAAARIMGLSQELQITLLPKSVTAPIARDISLANGGVAAITVGVVIMTGILGPILSPFVLRLLRIRNPIAQGIALGTAAHGGGTAKAMEMGVLQGALSGLAMGIAGVVTAIIVPVIVYLILL